MFELSGEAQEALGDACLPFGQLHQVAPERSDSWVMMPWNHE
ncbi:hypothetical protein [Sorangium sp. So ce1389]